VDLSTFLYRSRVDRKDGSFDQTDLARLLWTVQKDPVDCLSKSSGLMLPI